MLLTERNRRLALLVSTLAIVALMLLAAGLGSLELQPGRPFPGRFATADEEESAPRPAPAILADTLLLVVGIPLMLLLCLAVLYSWLSADSPRRRLHLLVLLLGLLGLFLAVRASPPPEPPPPATETAPETAPEEELPAGPAVPIVKLEVRPPAWLAWLAAAILALAVAGLILGTAWLIWSRAQQPSGPLPQLAEQAWAALAELEAGADVRDTVMRCYLQMSSVLEQERGLVRDDAMTPREFEAALRRAGLPQEPVTRLTYLFEGVRYSTTRPGSREEEEAVASLSAIVAAARSLG
jgi:hypothetical protein